MARCKHTKDDGTRCQAPEEFVDRQTGFCRNHGPGASERMSEQGRKGAKVTAKRLKAPALELGPLESHEDAKRWLQIIGRAVLSREVTDRSAQAAIRSVEAWLKAEGERVTMYVITELKADVDRLKRELGGKPRMVR